MIPGRSVQEGATRTGVLPDVEPTSGAGEPSAPRRWLRRGVLLACALAALATVPKWTLGWGEEALYDGELDAQVALADSVANELEDDDHGIKL